MRSHLHDNQSFSFFLLTSITLKRRGSDFHRGGFPPFCKSAVFPAQCEAGGAPANNRSHGSNGGGLTGIPQRTKLAPNVTKNGKTQKNTPNTKTQRQTKPPRGPPTEKVVYIPQKKILLDSERNAGLGTKGFYSGQLLYPLKRVTRYKRRVTRLKNGIKLTYSIPNNRIV